MAKRRCFSIDVIESIAYRKLSNEAKVLYFGLIAHADDEGVVINHNIALCIQGVEESALQELVDNCFIIKINELYIIKHWYMHNRIHPSKFTKSVYQSEISRLFVNERHEYDFL